MSPGGGATTARVTFVADHPSLPGHFPGRPIIPGVLLLDAVMQAAGLGRGRLLRAKFTAPVGPGEAVDIDLMPRHGDRIAFACRCGDRLVLSGEFAC